MAVESVKSVVERIGKKGKSSNRFSKKNFNDLMKAVLNDPDYTAAVAKVKNGELEGVDQIKVGEEFRKFLKKVLEKAGVDKKESEVVLDSATFTIDNVDGLYEFIAHTIYEYMVAGNTFEFPQKEDFKGSITVDQKEDETKVADARNPQTGEEMGTFEYTSKAHKVLKASSPCPDYLKSRKKIK